MRYCISDIHGEYDRYVAMLEKIGFSDADRLYVLGDAIDRYPGGTAVLLDIMSCPNVRMILGNHEVMCLDAMHNIEARHLWQTNGGHCTRSELFYGRSKDQREAILAFLRSLPDHLDVEVNGREFHLVHGYPANNRYDRVWNRPNANAPAPIPGKTAIIGHTPTAFLSGDMDHPLHIWHGAGFIDIDCGCGNKTENRRLACLRLEDMQEFYV